MKKPLPSFLRPGDIVDIIAPASAAPVHKFEKGCAWLKHHGFIPRFQEGLLQPEPFFASPVKTQWEHLEYALHSDSKAIWCLRGGYGSMRMIPFLQKMKAPKKPKWLIGFSDITSLHLFFAQAWKWPTLHGHVLSQMDHVQSSPDREELLKFLTGDFSEPKIFSSLVPLNHQAVRERIIKAPLTGGNLRILQTSLGTPWELDARGKILFMEDIGERGYSVDRMLEQMIQARIINRGLKALIFGNFSESEEKDGKDFVAHALEKFAQKVPYPVLKGLPCGHSPGPNYPLPFNIPYQLKTGLQAELTYKLF